MANPAESHDHATQSGFLVVGLGASAGGVEALRDFFSAVPADSGIAYVVILHLSPTYESQLAPVLQTVAPLPVTQVTERVRVVPNHVYVVPPSQHLTMVDGEVTVSPNTLAEERRAPIDIFFRTLAETHESRAVCVVLSGTGADGSMGLKRIKERGGAVFVQNPREATFNEMPRHAISTDLVDDVLPVASIPARIVAYGSRQGTIAIPLEAEERPQEQQALREVLSHLRARTGHDFSNYKRPTLLRRIERCITVRELPDLPAYAALLRENPDETQALLKDLLISVTNFFRDKDAFTALEQEILPRLFQGKRSDTQVRIWVAGCASGEEAYSIALLCAERVLDTLDAPGIQIFATDINEAAIAHAREGLYSATDTADVSPERLRRFFTVEDQCYRIRREIREMVLFANHNLLKDPPFSHLDLISCRNMMIYLNHIAQERVMETLHFALNPGGYLFLGTSESVDGASDLYAIVNREQHIFRSRQTGTRPFPVPESVPALRVAPPRRAPSEAEADAQARERISDEAVHQRLLEEYAPPSAVVNADYDIVHLSERAGRYLQVSGGKVSNNLLKLIRPELRVELRSALYQALQQQTNVDTGALPLRIGDHTEILTIRVRPVLRHDDPARGLLLVIFEQGTEMPSDVELVVRSGVGATQQLEDEMQRLKQQLRTSSEQYEIQAEELKAANEELQALNEELRSSNEELGTGKEELQSLNEELRTVNQELKVKIEEATQTSTNLQNLVNSADIGTVFLDRGLRIKLFTPSARVLFSLIPVDYGRPLADITHRLVDIDVMADAETVLETLQPIEREVHTTTNQMFVLRVLPYRVAEDRIGGVVLTFVDITERKRVEETLRESEQRLLRMVNVPRVGVLTFDYTGTMLSANDAFLAMVGYSRAEFEAQTFTWHDFTPPDHVDASEQTMDQLRETGRGGPYEKEYVHKNGSLVWMMFVAANLGDGTIVEYVIDISDHKRAEEALRASEERQVYRLRLSDALRTLDDPVEVQAAVSQITLQYFNSDRCFYCEIEQGNAIIRRDSARDNLPSVAGVYAFSSLPIFKAAIDTGSPFVIRDVHTTALIDEQLKDLCIQFQLISFIDVPVIKDGRPVGILCITQSSQREWTTFDVELAVETAERTWAAVEHARAAKALHESKARLQLALGAAGMGTFLYHVMEDRGEPDARMLALFGLPEDGALNLAEALAHLIHPDDRGRYAADVARATDPEFDGTLHSDIRVLQPDGSIRWIAVTAQVVFEGQPRRATQMYGVAADITEHKRAEQRQAFLLQLSDALRPLSDPIEIQNVVMRVLGQHLGIARARYYEVDPTGEYVESSVGYAKSAPPAATRFRLDDFGPHIGQTYRAGHTMVVSDIDADARVSETERKSYEQLGVRALVGVPLIKNDRFVASLGVVHDSPRDWLEPEVALIEEVAERTWGAVERARAEAALRESEQRLRVMIENLPGGAAFIVDRDLRYVLADGEALQRAGFTPNDLVGKTLSEALGPELASKYQATYGRALAGEPFMVEHDDHGRSFVTRGTPLRSATGEVYSVLAVSYDITARKQAEIAVRESEERFRLLVEGARDYAMFLLDLDGRISFWSAGAERVFGWSQDEAIGQSGSIIFTPEDRERGAGEHEIQAAVKQGRAEDRRWHVRRDSTRLFLDGVLIRLDDDNKQVRAFVKIGRDATAHRQAEEALQRAHDELESRVQERTSELGAANDLLQQEIVERKQLAAQRAVLLERILTEQETERQRIARELHDTLGQFLSALSMRLSMAQALEGMPSRVTEELAQLQALSRQMNNEVDRLTMELRPPALQDFGLPRALRSYTEEWSATSGVPVDVLVTGLDTTRLRPAIETTVYRIVQEALTNVLKHAQASTVSLVVERRPGELRVIIEDNGVGFQGSASITHGTGGRQVGLIGMAERMTLVGGELTIESMPGSGTTIYLYIPIGEDTAEGTGNSHA